MFRKNDGQWTRSGSNASVTVTGLANVRPDGPSCTIAPTGDSFATSIEGTGVIVTAVSELNAPAGISTFADPSLDVIVPPAAPMTADVVGMSVVELAVAVADGEEVP